jgi:uncharacterized protein YfeS
MKLINFISILSCLLIFSCTNGQKNKDSIAMDNFQYSLKTSHPHAQSLMKEDFFWSPIEETGPFGSDDGSDAAYGFRQWRASNKSTSPIKYLQELIREWNYPYFDWNEMDTIKIKQYIIWKAELDEKNIQQQIEQLKEYNKNSPDSSGQKLTDEQLRKIVATSSAEMGGIYLLGQDNAIIGTAFAQFVLEGIVDNDLKKLTIIALERQLLPLLINRYDSAYKDKRKEQLTKMLTVMKKA